VRCKHHPVGRSFIGNSRQSTEPASVVPGRSRGTVAIGRRLLQREGPLRDAGGGAAAGQDPAQLHGIDVTVSPVGSLVGLSVPPAIRSGCQGEADQVRCQGETVGVGGGPSRRLPDEVEETPCD